MSLVELRGIGKTVLLPTGDPLHILTGVDLTLERGEHVAIVGRSGSGKSTLLNLLGLLDSPTGGQYLLDGEPTERLSGVRRSRLRGRTFGFVFQQFNLLPGRTATENAALPLRYATGTDFWRRNALSRLALEQVGLGERLDALPDRLSGGEQQRVAIARALVRSPQIILADEPTGALDVETGATVMELLQRVCHERGATLVTITHDPAIAARADRRFRLDHGYLAPVESVPAAPAPVVPAPAAATKPTAATAVLDPVERVTLAKPTDGQRANTETVTLTKAPETPERPEQPDAFDELIIGPDPQDER